MGPVERIAAVLRAERPRRALRFATIGVDEFRRRTRRQADVGPVLERVASLYRRMENTGGNELVPSTSGGLARTRSWRHKFRDDAPMGGHGNPLSRFDSPNIPAVATWLFQWLTQSLPAVADRVVVPHAGDAREPVAGEIP